MEGVVGTFDEVEEKATLGGHHVTLDDTESFSGSTEDECGGSSCSSSNTSCSEETAHCSVGSEGSTVEQPAKMGWPLGDAPVSRGLETDEENNITSAKETEKPNYTVVSEVDMMKERFSKLLLGEDMSGCGKGVCSALAISNAITNLCATIFGQLWRLEPLSPEKKSMWQREMDWLLCVSDHIVELVPTWQTFPDGSKLEVMTCRQRLDLHINLPALRKLDHMLLEILDSFSEAEFWYVEQGIQAPDVDGSGSFRGTLQRQGEKWWLPVPRVPSGGLNEKARKHLQHKRESANQILKAAMAINSNAVAEMEIPESYLSSLPKNGRASLGDLIYRYITSDQFSPECLLDCLDLSSEHQALEIANRVEAAIYIWRKQTVGNSLGSKVGNANKTSWSMVKDLIIDADKRDLLADRAESLMVCLKQRFPGLTQTTLDMTKIQFNKDIGKSIMESYSRVLESLAFNIIARIDELLYVDDISHSDNHLVDCRSSLVAQKKLPVPHSVPPSGTQCATDFGTLNLSSLPLISPARGERLSLISRISHNRGFDVKKVLMNYLSGEVKGKTCISNEFKQRISSMNP